MTDKTLKQHVTKCGDLKAKIDDLTALYNAEKDYIIDALKERQSSDFKASSYIVKLCDYTQNRLNGKALKNDQPEIYNKYLTSVKTSRFTVKAV